MTALLELANVSKSFGSLTVTDRRSFHLDDGEALGVIGPDGAGKSTFLRGIAGLFLSTADSVSFDGRPVRAMPANDLVKLRIAMVPEGRRHFFPVRHRVRMDGDDR